MTQLGNNPPQNPRGRNKLVLKSPGTFVGGGQINNNPISNHIHTTPKFREKNNSVVYKIHSKSVG